MSAGFEPSPRPPVQNAPAASRCGGVDRCRPPAAQRSDARASGPRSAFVADSGQPCRVRVCRHQAHEANSAHDLACSASWIRGAAHLWGVPHELEGMASDLDGTAHAGSSSAHQRDAGADRSNPRAALLMSSGPGAGAPGRAVGAGDVSGRRSACALSQGRRAGRGDAVRERCVHGGPVRGRVRGRRADRGGGSAGGQRGRQELRRRPHDRPVPGGRPRGRRPRRGCRGRRGCRAGGAVGRGLSALPADLGRCGGLRGAAVVRGPAGRAGPLGMGSGTTRARPSRSAPQPPRPARIPCSLAAVVNKAAGEAHTGRYGPYPERITARPARTAPQPATSSTRTSWSGRRCPWRN
ncbi:hypothetical protein SMICM17S_04160 [Streptomyces microflavus]